MKEVLDIVVLILFIYILFILIRGVNKTQMKKHKDKIKHKENFK